MIEATLSICVLTIIALVLLHMSLNVIYPRQWTVLQTVTDAYMTYEKSYAQRIDFGTLTSASSPWPAYPLFAKTAVTIGYLPGGLALTGNVYRFRTANPNNLPANGGTGTTTTNPSNMNAWTVQSVLTYSISGRNYYKSRTVIRNQ